MRRITLLVLATFFVTVATSAQTIRYVKEGGTGEGNFGWIFASGDLRAVLDAAQPGDQVWVAAGTYFPSSPIPGSGHSFQPIFYIPEGVEIYGGFAGWETNLSQRNWQANPTYLINIPDHRYPVLVSTNTTNATLLDGFTIKGGNNNGNIDHIFSGNGGGMNMSNSSMRISNCVFTDNSALLGGAIYMYDSSPDITNCIFERNRAVTPIHGGGSGGAIHAFMSSPTIKDCIFTNGEAVSGAGISISNYDFSDESISPKIINCTFSYNNASNEGGGITITGKLNLTEITNCTFTYNEATIYGGGISIDRDASPIIKGCNFSGNEARGDETIFGIEGGGGGIFIGKSLLTEITDCTFSNNFGLRGGGVFLENNENENYFFGTGVTITNCTFTENLSNRHFYEYGGDAIYNGLKPFLNTPPNTHRVSIIGGTFIGTEGAIHTAALIWNENSSPLISKCKFQSTLWGIANSDFSAPTIRNSLFTGNSGHAIKNDDSSPTIINSTISGNNGGILNKNGSSPEINNTIIWGNNNGITGDGSQITYSLVQGINATSNGNIPANSITSDIFTDDYALNPGCPAINAGNNTVYVDTGGNLENDLDLAGNPRVYGYNNGGIIDMGAYESAPEIIYVKKGSSGDGSSWTNALGELADALKFAKNHIGVQQIWVAGGIYKPLYSPADNNFGNQAGRDNTFLLIKDVKIYGNFAGNENSLEERNLTLSENASILSGDLDNNGVPSDNDAYHVVISAGDFGTATLDGFTITGGNANGSGSITVKELSVSRSYGGAMRNINASPLLVNLKVTGNNATHGGGITNYNASPIIINSLFTENTATGYGGALHNDAGAAPKLVNVTIASNTATTEGEAMRNFDSAPVIQNSIVFGSISNNTGGTSNYTYSLVEGNTSTSNGNINTSGITPEDIFVNPGGNNYYLQTGSPAINTGNNDYVIVHTDLSGNPRILYNLVDMGAYEYPPASSLNDILYVKKGSTGDGSNWENAIGELKDALALAENYPSVQEIWVTAGEYYPPLQSFRMVEGVKIYGGFSGTETTLDERDFTANITTLRNINSSTKHIIKNDNNGLTPDAVLDGFVIRDGNATSGSNIDDFYGGGIFNENSSPTISNCIFINNRSQYGGGIYNRNSSPIISNCTFNNNEALHFGGAIRNDNSSPVIINSLFTNNSSPTSIISNDNSSSLKIINSTFTENELTQSNGSVLSGGIPLITNSIVYGNSLESGVQISDGATVTFSIVEGGYAGEGNKNTNPLFVGNGDYTLQLVSPAINAGNNLAYTNAGGDLANDLDLAGNPRVELDVIDMGAYEFQPSPDDIILTPDENGIVYVKPGGMGNGSNWDQATGDLQSAIYAPGAQQVWVAEGTYQPEEGQSFSMKEEVGIYGGFAGNETELNQRNWTDKPTILQGNGGYVIFNDENSLNENSILDGFTITGGSRGMHNNNVSPTIRNSVISGNGTGIWNENSSFPVIINSVISGSSYGIYNRTNSTIRIINCTLSNNTTYAIYSWGSYSAGADLQNSIVWGNYRGISLENFGLAQTTFTNSLIQDFPGEGEDPQFTDAGAGDYSLQASSPAVNAGSNALFIGLDENTKDLAGNPRLFDNTIDIGAYESQTIPIPPPPIIYVKKGSYGNGDSWENAYGELADALVFAKKNTGVQQIWVAQGTYKPMYSPVTFNDAGRDNTFLLVNNVRLYGGFAGTETTLEDRNWASNPTILSGDLDNSNTLNDNDAYHVVLSIGNVGTARLDGFTITGGNAYGSSSLIINGILISRNEGGGMHNRSSSPTLTNVTISGNTANNRGGGMYNSSSSPALTNVLISENTANTNGGGGVYNLSGNGSFINCTVTGNSPNELNISNGTLTLKNTIVWGDIEGTNYTAENCLIKGNNNPDNGNLVVPDDAEIFTNPSAGDYSLTGSSPAINTGNNALFIGLDENTKDLAGNPRVYGGTIDIGAYERNSSCISETLWNGTVWSNGTPDEDKRAIIEGDLNITEDMEACELLLNSGILTVVSGNALTVHGAIVNTQDAENFIVESGANLIQIDDVANTGEITVRRNSTPMYRLDTTLWSSPVEGQNLFDFSPGTLTNRFYYYDAVNNIFDNVGLNEDSVFEAATGYGIRSPNTYNNYDPEDEEGLLAQEYPGEFIGVPHNGDYESDTFLWIGQPYGYNLVGNPYPSALDATKFTDANNDVETLYFWTHLSRPLADGTYPAGNYAAWSPGMDGGTPAEAGGDEPNGIIEPGQGFFVRTIGSSVTFNNTMRTKDEGIFYFTEPERHRFWLNLESEHHTHNQILIGYVENATLGFDHRIDANMMNYNGNALSSIIEDASTGSVTQRLVIQGRPLPFDDTDVVPLGFKAVHSGHFTISIEKVDGLFEEGQKIYIKDGRYGILHDLTESGYTFYSPPGEHNERFEIVYATEGEMGIEDIIYNNILIYGYDFTVYIHSQVENIAKVEIYDLLGRKLYQRRLSEAETEAHSIEINTETFGNQLLLVRVYTQDGRSIVKRVVNR